LPLRIQLWSWNYVPEPTAMGPIAAIWARSMLDRGYDVDVVSAHPHYPGPIWGMRYRPYREQRDGLRVTRLPLWIGRGRASARIREEATYAASAAVAMASLSPPDVYVVVSPSFAALAPMILNTRLRRRPWILWLQDIFPDAATTTDLLREGTAPVRLARRLELAAYTAATRIVVISETFRESLIAKGVPPQKLTRIYNPASNGFDMRVRRPGSPLRILYVGNIGHSQGLERFVRAFERAPVDAKLVIVGTGECAAAVAAEVRSSRVEVRGLVDDAAFERELDAADVALVTQRPDVVEFNVPSRLMTLLARGIPVVAATRPESEVRRLLDETGAGWVVDSRSPDELSTAFERIAAAPDEAAHKSALASAYAQAHFSPDVMAGAFAEVVESVARGRRPADGLDR
jgi:colanic acid biosynthesis glycosyl transferase WcaI